MPTTLTPGAEFQVNKNAGANNNISGHQVLPDIALLPDGRFIVTYSSAYFGSNTDFEAVVSIFNATGATSLAYLDIFQCGRQSAGLGGCPAPGRRVRRGLRE